MVAIFYSFFIYYLSVPFKSFLFCQAQLKIQLQLLKAEISITLQFPNHPPTHPTLKVVKISLKLQLQLQLLLNLQL